MSQFVPFGGEFYLFSQIFYIRTSHKHTWCGNKETRLLLLLISGHVDDEEEGRALTRGLPCTFTQSFIHVHQLVWPYMHFHWIRNISLVDLFGW